MFATYFYGVASSIGNTTTMIRVFQLVYLFSSNRSTPPPSNRVEMRWIGAPFSLFLSSFAWVQSKEYWKWKKNPLIWWWHGGAQTAHGIWYLCLYLIVTRVYHGFVVAPNDTNITYKLQSMYPIPCAIHTWLPADDARMKIKNAEKNSNLSQNAMQCHLWCLSTSILFLTHKVRRYFRRRQQAFAHLSPARQDDYSGINQTP